MNIVLLEPEIPQNTGNIVRTAAATGSVVHLIKPLGFDISEKSVKRAGLDYWHYVDIRVYENLEDFLNKNFEGQYTAQNGTFKLNKGARLFYASTKAGYRHDEVKFLQNDFVMFGKETRGLPEELLHENYDNAFRIPMIGDIRSLNLANSVAIVVYEALRQTDYVGFNEKGHLTKF
ncbi:MAG: tRNA (cytidine(34)-2'-O)-methyltransferase [Acidaminococcus sp.]|nr:tRNA (cytidine(34)-2'-O)-methyltransferase [Acidaminococcus sp.]MDD7398409.1 tRNA (cytidine(34)-2'-O)-methyltransferase [Bacillota bacterium]MDY4559263.1 tRNA (cytidine(34)-2'-O)-methyltransferase [Eubacteriales bacterium]MDY5345452.1 tRNA (cytidine(34)-2'-O)-methyltransferase [Eubacteriales bacterium]